MKLKEFSPGQEKKKDSAFRCPKHKVLLQALPMVLGKKRFGRQRTRSHLARFDHGKSQESQRITSVENLKCNEAGGRQTLCTPGANHFDSRNEKPTANPTEGRTVPNLKDIREDKMRSFPLPLLFLLMGKGDSYHFGC